jgi:4-amino-4-deoxy-L-arabinose transferase-like glycosyltransferase
LFSQKGSVSSQAVFWAALAGFSLLVTLLAATWHDFPVPANDSVEYLAYARSLHIAGVYAATEAGPAADAIPGREPLYSLVIAGLARLHPTWSTALRDCSPPMETCASGLIFLKYANVVFLALAAVIAGATIRALGGSHAGAIVATGYVSLNFTIWRWLKYVISDYLAVLLVAIGVLSLILALRRQTDPRAWTGLGIVLALLALTKQVFLPFAVLLAIGFLIHGLVIRRQRCWSALVPGLSVLTVVAAINGGWALRNIALFGVMNDGRGSIALSTREVFDNMSSFEHGIAFLWFMRPPGRNIARRWFPEEDWRRFEWEEPDGFYLQGQVTNHAARVAQLKSGTGVSDAVAQARASGVVIREIFTNWTGYLASMPAIFYRGLWFDAFMPLSLPLFFLPFLWAWRERLWLLPVALSPALWSLFIYPAISLNIPRYQFTVVIALAITAGLAADRLKSKRRTKSCISGTPRYNSGS